MKKLKRYYKKWLIRDFVLLILNLLQKGSWIMILENVNYPEDLKQLNIEDKKILASEIREKIIE